MAKLPNTMLLGALIAFPMFLVFYALGRLVNPWLATLTLALGLYFQGKWAMLFIDAVGSDPTKVR